MSSSRGPLTVTWLLVLCLFYGLYLFASGFFLTRLELPYYSTCDDFRASTLRSNSSIDACWLKHPPRFKKLVLLVVDAWRYDFAEPVTQQSDDLPHYRGKMPKLAALLEASERSKTDSALLFRFIADTPTVTMQRLKGLLTGGLPTFIDISANFAAGVLVEDNIIHQLHTTPGRHANNSRRQTVFMGDDTWVGLFPSRFDKVYPFPSFDVRDLDTVDNGILSHLMPAITDEGNAVVVAHFLGVDHVGHRFNTPHHTEMARKLRQIDDIIADVVEAVDEDTLVTVLGDHGMTESGAHGGASDAETNAALFLFAKQPHLGSQWLDTSAEVHQVDLAPTLSFLLGLPIPYAAIGSALPLTYAAAEVKDVYGGDASLLQALAANSMQLIRYMHSYQQLTSSFPPEVLQALDGELASIFSSHMSHVGITDIAEQSGQLRKPAQSDAGMLYRVLMADNNTTITTAQDIPLPRTPSIAALIKRYSILHRDILTTCRSLWVQYDENKMLVGMTIIVMVLILQIMASVQPSLLDALTSSTSLAAHILRDCLVLSLAGYVLADSSTFSAILRLLDAHNTSAYDGQNLLGWISSYIFGLGQLAEMVVPNRLPFLQIVALSCLARIIVAMLMRTSPKLYIQNISLPFIIMLLLVILRLDCFFTNSFITREADALAFLCLSVSVVLLLFFAGQSPMGPHQWMVCGTALLMVLTKGTQQVTGWGWPFRDPAESMPQVLQQTGTGQSAIGWSFEVPESPFTDGTAFALILLPFALQHLERRSLSLVSWLDWPLWVHAGSNALVCLYWHMDHLGRLDSQKTYRLCLPRLVYAIGLSTLCIATVSRTGRSAAAGIRLLLPTLTLISGPRSWISLHACYAHSLVLSFIAELLPPTSGLFSSAHAIAFGWHWMAAHYYFATGHGNQFNSLHFNAAFIGFDAYSPLLSTAIMIFNTYASLVILIPQAFFSAARFNVSTAAVTTLAPCTISVFAICLSCYLMRRHLMVWAIFAPKFIFEAGGFAVTTVIAMALYSVRELRSSKAHPD